MYCEQIEHRIDKPLNTSTVYKSYKLVPISPLNFSHNLQLSSMYNFQFSEFTMDPRNQWQFLPLLLSVNPFVMQQLIELQTNTMPSYVGFYGLPFDIGPAYRGMAQHHCHQYRSGLSSNRCRKRFCKAETQHQYNLLHESSRSLSCPCDSCRNPVIPVESGGIQQNYFWQRFLPKLPFRGPFIPAE